MNSGFIELKHTADVAIGVWAPDFSSLLEAAASGMYTLMGAEFGEPIPDVYSFKVNGIDRESLMVAFLSELLYIYEKDHAALKHFTFIMYDGQLEVQNHGLNVSNVRREIKAVTFHNLEIKEGDKGLEVVIVFDV